MMISNYELILNQNDNKINNLIYTQFIAADSIEPKTEKTQRRRKKLFGISFIKICK